MSRNTGLPAISVEFDNPEHLILRKREQLDSIVSTLFTQSSTMSKTHKFILWSVLVAITSFWVWAGVQAWLRTSLFEVPSNILITLSILFVLLLSLMAIGLVLFQDRLWSVYLSLICGVTFLILFGISNINLVGVFIFVMLVYHAQDIVHSEVKERLKLNPRLLIRRGLMNFIVAFFVLISFAAFQSPAIESFKEIQELPTSTGVFIKKITEQTLSGQLAQVEPQQKEAVLNQVAQEIMREANLFLAPYFQYAPPALAFGLFLVLWGLGWLYIGLAMFLGTFIFWILRKVKFVKIEERDAKAEILIV